MYKMTASPRGIALIININTVEGIKDRDGSAEDFKLMQKLFQDLGFEVISRKNLSTDVGYFASHCKCYSLYYIRIILRIVF